MAHLSTDRTDVIFVGTSEERAAVATALTRMAREALAAQGMRPPGTHYPAHESLQQYAARHGLTVAAAYAAWHDRPYPALISCVHFVRRGPGLGVHLRDLRVPPPARAAS